MLFKLFLGTLLLVAGMVIIIPALIAAFPYALAAVVLFAIVRKLVRPCPTKHQSRGQPAE